MNSRCETSRGRERDQRVGLWARRLSMRMSRDFLLFSGVTHRCRHWAKGKNETSKANGQPSLALLLLLLLLLSAHTSYARGNVIIKTISVGTFFALIWFAGNSSGWICFLFFLIFFSAFAFVFAQVQKSLEIKVGVDVEAISPRGVNLAYTASVTCCLIISSHLPADLLIFCRICGLLSLLDRTLFLQQFP